jgi:hypothetical protein
MAGYLPPASFKGQFVEFLDLSGKAISLNLDEVKWLCFVRDFNSGEVGNPERLLRKSFAGRPRGDGVWLRLRLKDGELLEGLASNDLTLLDLTGLLITPPDIRSNTQRVFIPRSTIAELTVIAVISSAIRKKVPPPPVQEGLFHDPE